MEVIPLKVINSESIIKFIDQFIITIFGLPSALIFDNPSYFLGTSMIEFVIRRASKLKYFSNYYSHGNVLAELTNKNILRIIKIKELGTKL